MSSIHHRASRAQHITSTSFQPANPEFAPCVSGLVALIRALQEPCRCEAGSKEHRIYDRDRICERAPLDRWWVRLIAGEDRRAA